MKRKILFKMIVVLWLFSLTAGAQTQEELPLLPKGPLLLTSTTPEQFHPDYWVNRLSDPDKILKTSEEIEVLNENTRAMVRDQIDVFKMPLKRDGRSIRELLELQYNMIKGRILFTADDSYIPKSLFEQKIKPVMQWDKVLDQIRIRWGTAVRPASVRALPIDVKMLEEKGDIEFDQLQFTLIKFWTPVAILHESSDGQWYFIQAPYTRGWVRSKDIALFSTRDELRKYVKSNSFLTVTGESIAIYPSPDSQNPILTPSMGTILPLAGQTSETYVVQLPKRSADGKVVLGKGYVSRKVDVSEGYLSFTQRNIIRQAFKMLGARYGWGGTYNGRDCSGFTQDVFLTVGVDMPRGSKEQGFTGTQLGWFNYKEDAQAKLEALRSAVPGITILRMPKHLMLYLGQVNRQFYVIHSTWAERYSMTSDAKNRINQVVVSDLNLNGKSYLGSLFDRIISMNEID